MFLHARHAGGVHVVPLATEVSTTDFDLEPAQKERAFQAGRNAAHEALWHIGLKPSMESALDALYAWMRGHVPVSLGRLRINVGVPENLGPFDAGDGSGLVLRLRFGHNMRGEPDYALTFKPGIGATGLCWDNNRLAAEATCVVYGRPEIENLPERMRRLVRADVKALVSVPVLYEGNLIGVCTFDTTEECHPVFSAPELQRDLIDAVANRIAPILARRPPSRGRHSKKG